MNKEQLEKASDYQLSSLILKSMPRDGQLDNEFQHNKIASRAAIEVINNSNYTRKYFDINNWADMGPLIERYYISLIAPEKIQCNEIWDARNDIEENCNESMSYEFISAHENPLRAAAIVYLLMQEV